MGLFGSWKTGRTRTLTVTGAMSAPAYEHYNQTITPAGGGAGCPPPPAGGGYGIVNTTLTTAAYGATTVKPLGGLLTVAVSMNAPNQTGQTYEQVTASPCYLYKPHNQTGGLHLQVSTPLGGTLLSVDVPLSADTYSLTYSVGVQVEEWTQTSSLTMQQAQRLPSQLGQNFDGPPLCSLTLFEQAITAGTVSWSVTLNGTTYSGTFSAPTSWQADYRCELSSSIRGTNAVNASSLAAASINGWAVTYPLTASFGGVVCDTGPGAKATLNGTSTAVVCDLLATPPVQYSLKGWAWAFEDDYPDSCSLKWYVGENAPLAVAVTGGSAGATYSQQSVVVTMNGTVQVSKNTISPVQAVFDASTLDDPRDVRCSFWAHRFNALTVQHTANVVLDDGSSTATWSGGSGMGFSASGGVLTITPGGGAFVATKTFASLQRTEGHRYLRIRCRTSAAQGFTLGIGPKTWSLGTASGGGFSTVLVDLCCPDSWGASPLYQDSRWPETAATHVPISEGKNWGVNAISALTLTLGGSLPMDVDFIDLQTQDHARLCVLPECLNYVRTTNVAGTDYASGRRAFLGDVDGRVALDEYDRFASFNSTGQLLAITDRLITDAATAINSEPAWTASAIHQTHGVLNESLPACFLAGGGATWAGGSATPVKQLALDVSSAATVDAQLLVDTVQGYPGCGDLFTGSGYDGAATPTVVGFGKFFRARAYGIAVDGSDHLMAGVTATVKQDSGALRGSGLSDAYGYYQTGLPYAIATKGHSVFVDGQSQFSFTAISRKWHRGWVKGKQSADGFPYILQTREGHLHRSSVKAGDLWYRQAHDSTPVPGWASAVQVTSTSDVSSQGRMAVDPVSRRIWIVYARSGGNAYTRYSDDYGQTWSAETLFMASSKYPEIKASPDGVLVRAVFQYVSGSSGPGTLVAQYKGPGDTSWSSPFALKDSGGSPLTVSDTPFSLDKASDYQDRWSLAVVIDGETDISDWYSTESKPLTFTRV